MHHRLITKEYNKEAMMTKLERAKKLAEAMDSVAESLTSHLPYTHKGGVCKNKKCRAELGDKKFNRKCVLEYARILVTLAEELEKL